MARYDFTFDKLDWRGKIGLFLAMVAGLALLAAIVLLSLGVALVLIPVAAVGYLVWRWRWNRLAKARPSARETISVDYHVVDKSDRRS
jgi:energy-coupling factor transporter transmembrane protein EcfT